MNALLQEYGAQLLTKTGEHLFIAAIALGLGVLVAVPVGLAITRTKRLGKIVMGIAALLQTVPSLALLAFMIPIFSVGKPPAIVALFLYSLSPIIRNTYIAITQVDAGLIDAAKGMGMTSGQILRKVELPLGMPIIMAGIRLSAVYVIAWTTLASYIGAGGLGDFIFTGLNNYKIDMLILGTIPISILAVLTDVLFGKLEDVLSPRTHSVTPVKGGQHA